MRYVKMLLAGALIIGFTAPTANAAPDDLRNSTAPYKGLVGKRGGRYDVPVIKPVGKYYYENDPFYGKYYRTQQYHVKHYAGHGNVN